MPHVQPEASVVQTGLGIRYIGVHCWAYSGIYDLSSPATALEFTTGSGYIVGKFEFNADFATGGGASMSVGIFLNEVQIIKERDTSNNWLTGDNEFHVIIPPFTKVRGDLTGGSQDASLNFTGRVYGAE